MKKIKITLKGTLQVFKNDQTTTSLATAENKAVNEMQSYSPSYLEQLPKDVVVYKIFPFFSLNELGKIAQTSKTFHNAVTPIIPLRLRQINEPAFDKHINSNLTKIMLLNIIKEPEQWLNQGNASSLKIQQNKVELYLKILAILIFLTSQKKTYGFAKWVYEENLGTGVKELKTKSISRDDLKSFKNDYRKAHGQLKTLQAFEKRLLEFLKTAIDVSASHASWSRGFEGLFRKQKKEERIYFLDLINKAIESINAADITQTSSVKQTL